MAPDGKSYYQDKEPIWVSLASNNLEYCGNYTLQDFGLYDDGYFDESGLYQAYNNSKGSYNF